VLVGLDRHHLLKVGAHAVHGQGVGRQGGAHAAMAVPLAAGTGPLAGRLHGAGHLRTTAIDPAGHATGDRLAEHEKVRFKVPQASTATDIGGDGVGFVDDQQCAIFTREFAALFQEARIGQDHADVGHRRLAEQGAHVTLGQCRL